MNNFSIDDFTRISKQKARLLYSEGVSVYICPVRMRPSNLWMSKMPEASDFDQWVNAFEYYNCSNETGKYAAFYIIKA